jgi:hypothetical protein
MASFHFVSGVIRNDVRLLTFSVVVVFLYGGLIWGIFPIDPKISWEGHLWGAVSGVVLAFYYRKYIIRRDKFDWEEDEEEETEEVNNTDEKKSERITTEDTTYLPLETEPTNQKQSGNKPLSTPYKPGNTSHTGEF